MKYFLPILLVLFVCCTSQKKKKEFAKKVNYTGAPTYVYKTKADYSKLVPILLNATKDSILAYPEKTDLKLNEAFTYPTALHKGYLLDQRGIGLYVAFLKLSYEEYSKLNYTPTEAQLLDAVLDKNPLTELYDLGSRYQYTNLVDSINLIIDEGDLKLHKRIK